MKNLLNKARLLSALLPESRFIFKKSGAGKTLFLTFDDGPDPDVTPALLDLLGAHGVRGTFFCIGQHIEAHSAIARRIHAEGHTLGNHSWSHRGFARLHVDKQVEEFSRTDTVLGEITGGENHLFRAPQGQWNLPLMMRVWSRGVTCVHWSHDSLDYRHDPADVLAARLAGAGLCGGEVLLFHDDNQLSLRILETLIPQWQAAGFGFSGL